MLDIACRCEGVAAPLVLRSVWGPSRGHIHATKRVQCGYLKSSDWLREDPERSAKYAQLGFYCPRVLYALVLMLLNVRLASIQTPRLCVASLVVQLKLFHTMIVAVSFGHICVLQSLLEVNISASVFAAANWISRLPAHSILSAAQASCF